MSQSPFFTAAFWLVLLPALWSSGSLVGCRLHEKSPLFSGFLKLSLGLGVYAYFLVLAGCFGCLRPWAVLFFLAMNLIPRWHVGMEFFRWFADLLRFWGGAHGTFSRICQCAMAAACFFTALFCFLPEIANDALAIQLHVAKLFVKNASVAPSFYDLLSYRPLLMSVLYSTGLLFQNVAIAKFFHWFCGVLLAGSVAVKVAEVTQDRKIALFFALMLWLTPTLMNQITTTYIDAGVSLLVFLGYCVVAEGFTDLKLSRFFYAGLFIGLSMGVRSLSLGAFFAITIMLGLRLLQLGNRKQVLFAGVFFTLGAFLTSSYWFLRNWLYTGNPVYPYFGTLFGTEDLSPFASHFFYGMGLPRSSASFLMIPWDITFRPHLFDYHHWAGPFYLIVLPFVAYAALKVKAARIHLQFVLFFTVFWYFTAQNVRYLLPVFPVYLLAGSMGLMHAFSEALNRKKWVRFASQSVAYTLIAFLLILTARHFRFQFLPVLGIWNQDLYLTKMERTIPVAKWIGEKLPRDAKILMCGGEYHFFYFDRDVIQEEDFSLRTHYEDQRFPEGMVAILKGKGITHILDAIETQERDLPDHPQKGHRSIDLLLQNRRFTQPLTSVPSSNVLGKRYQYILYKLV